MEYRFQFSLEDSSVFDEPEKRYMDIEEKRLHQLLLAGMQDIEAGRTFDFEDVFNEVGEL